MTKTEAHPSLLMRPLTPSPNLAAIVGSNPLPRSSAIKKMWAYIKDHQLQDVKDKRLIHADDNLLPIFGKEYVDMFEMTRLLSGHLKKQSTP